MVEVAAVPPTRKLATPLTENLEPGVEVPIPTFPLGSTVRTGTVEVAKVEGEEVER